MQPLYGIANFRLVNLNDMKALHFDSNQLKVEREIAWIITLGLVVAGFPLFKNAVIFILIKLYELLIQHVIGK